MDTLTPIVAEREDAVNDPYSEAIARLEAELPTLRKQFSTWGDRPFRWQVSELLREKEAKLWRLQDARRQVFGQDCPSCGG